VRMRRGAAGERGVENFFPPSSAGDERDRRFAANPTVTIRHDIPRSALVAAFVCALSLPGAAHDAFAVTFGPGADFEVRQDQLPGAESGSEGWIARVSPRLSILRTTPISTLQLSGNRSFDSNERLSGPTWVGDEAGLRFDTTPGPYTRFSAFAGYVSSRDPLGTRVVGPVTFNESAIATAGGRLELWRLEGGYQVRSHTYESSTHVDGLSQTWEAMLFPMRRPDTRLVLSGRGRDVKIEGARAMRTVDVTAGWQRTHFEGLSSIFEVGVAATHDDYPTEPYDMAVVAGLTADRGTLRLPVDLRFQFVRDVATTGFAEVSLPGRRNRLAVRFEQTLGAEGGSFPDPTLSKYVTFDVRDTLFRGYALSVEGSFGKTRSYFDAGPWLDTNRLWASVSRGLTTWMSMGIDYSFVNQDGDASRPSWVFQRNRLGLRLTLGAQ
jgi:hypothetical protein